MDELRVDDIRKKRAISGILNVQAKLADLGRLSLELERRSGDFQDLQGRASGNTTDRLRLGGQLNLNKFLPTSWNTSIPVRFNYNRSTSIPRIRPGSDIVLTSEQRKDESNVQSQSLFNISLRKRAAPRDSGLFARLFFDRISASMNLGKNNSESGAIHAQKNQRDREPDRNVSLMIWANPYRDPCASSNGFPFSKESSGRSSSTSRQTSDTRHGSHET